jgi:hypothetical protein
MLNIRRMQGNLLVYSPQGNKKILVINKLENFIIFMNSPEGGHMSPPYDPSWPINRGPPPCHAIYLGAWYMRRVSAGIATKRGCAVYSCVILLCCNKTSIL